MNEPALREEADGLRDLYSFLHDLGLDGDVNPCSGAIGVVDETRLADTRRFRVLVERLGLCDALANVLDVEPPDVRCSLVYVPGTVDGDIDDMTAIVSSYHNATPLTLDEVVHVACWRHRSGKHAVFVKVNHLIADLPDVTYLVEVFRDYLQGVYEPEGADAVPLGDYYRGHGEAVRRYAGLPRADVAAVETSLGGDVVPRVKGIPTISASTGYWLPVREGVRFNEILSVVSELLLETFDSDFVLQYPFSQRTMNGSAGYYGEIRPLVIRAEQRGTYDVAHFRRARALYESAGRFTMSDLPAFAGGFTRGRVPRIVVSDTTFMRPRPDRWDWVPVLSARTFEDLKFLIDRSWPGPPLMRVQYKRRFLPADTATTMLGKLEQRIGVQCISQSY
ncbi:MULTISPECIES: hypothetical protein [Rhodococcus]|uniref:hypothetical protein n=1 Tax=Rhodococcus TaxID=1827 RepID=UPI000BE447F7|nr:MULTISPECIES: hypothetical protein [Rhodococcus]ATI36486.1 hypothetical protein CPI83_30290 [Rhodococcus sp. H-CA8f]QXC46165.1 hypothetical protein KSE96_30860 [Rhodococcus qingshengii]